MMNSKFSLKMIGKGNLIGLEDVILDRQHTLTLKCFSPVGKTLCIPAKELHNYIDSSEKLNGKLL